MKHEVLVCDMLFNEEILDIDYDYSNEEEVVRVAIRNEDGIRKYIAYETGERGNILWIKEFNNLNGALDFARQMWIGLKSINNSNSLTLEPNNKNF